LLTATECAYKWHPSDRKNSSSPGTGLWYCSLIHPKRMFGEIADSKSGEGKIPWGGHCKQVTELITTNNSGSWYHGPTMGMMLHTFVYASKFGNPRLIMWKHHTDSNCRVLFKVVYQHSSKVSSWKHKKIYRNSRWQQRGDIALFNLFV
jgi:hypothetical protein